MTPSPSPTRLPVALAALAALAGCAGAAAPTAAPGPAPAYRIYEAGGAPLDGVPALVTALEGVDVLFFGEQHDDSLAHRLERELLEELARRGRPVVVGMEMFERDVQPSLDGYLAGTIDEAEFLASSRPWPGYAAAYRPLVEVARREGWPVVATNLPRPLAAAVSREGIGALADLDAAARGMAADDLRCPRDEYHRRFVEALGEHPLHGAGADSAREATLLRYYQAQCAKDETMAESIAAAWREGTLLVHFNGAFHTDHRLGIVPRLRRRLPGARVAVVSVVPVPDPRGLPSGADVADFLIHTRVPAASP